MSWLRENQQHWEQNVMGREHTWIISREGNVWKITSHERKKKNKKSESHYNIFRFLYLLFNLIYWFLNILADLIVLITDHLNKIQIIHSIYGSLIYSTDHLNGSHYLTHYILAKSVIWIHILGHLSVPLVPS